MSHTYTLELDIPFTALTQHAFSKARLLRDVDHSRGLDVGSDCWLEPTTGTLMLKPLHLDPTDHYDSSADAFRLELDAFDYVENKWEANVLSVPGTGTVNRSRAKGHTLIEDLEIAAITTLYGALQANGVDLIPILASKAEYPINQAFYVEAEVHGSLNARASHQLSVQFGDFRLDLHMAGYADLYWSTDGSCDSDHWEWRKRFGVQEKHNDSNKPRANIMSFPWFPNSIPKVSVIPFGRGGLWVHVGNQATGYSGVYSHPEAAFDSGENRYHITAAGKLIVWVPKSYEQSIGVSIGKVGYKTSGSFTDAKITMPDVPATGDTLTLTPYWITTMGTPTVTEELLDSTGATFTPDGSERDVYCKFSLAGDGNATPWMDCYLLNYEQKVEERTPALITIPQADIMTMNIGDGEDWEDRKASFVIRDWNSNPQYTDLRYRSEINGRLLIDDEPYGVYLFRRPKSEVHRSRTLITLSGWNYGVARVANQRFLHPRPYESWQHPNAIADILKRCGWDAADIEATAEDVTISGNALQGSGGDNGPGELKAQPAVNSYVREFIQWIIDNFSGWNLTYAADGKWYYAPPTAITTGDLTIHMTTKPSSGDMWLEHPLIIETEPPECNYMVLAGQKDNNDMIANSAYDQSSIASVAATKPRNYLGRVESLIVVDKSINSITAVNAVLNKLFPVLSKARVWLTGRGPFDQRMIVGHGYEFEGIGVAKLVSFEGSASTVAQLEKSACITYQFELLPEAEA